MDESFLQRIKDEALAFNRKLDSQIRALVEEGLMTVEEQEHLKVTALRYREALEESLSLAITTPIQESLISNLVKDYEEVINKKVSKFFRRKYSEKRIKKQINELIHLYWSKNFSHLSQDSRISKIKKEVESLQLDIWNNLKSNFKISSEEQKPILVEQALKSLQESLISINSKYLPKSDDVNLDYSSEREEAIPKGITWVLLRREKDKLIRYLSPKL